ncbi:MAG: glycosyltransferase family 2 protein [Thermoleophilia bacterium]|nr:glycosyltransferase family 2 protein [Thermoleophilia bacterium]
MKTLVFIPAWNEADSIRAVVEDAREHVPGAHVLVIDDGSGDETAVRARQAGARVASLPFNQGVGAAHQTGYIYAMANGYELCGQIDGDGQHPAAELTRLLAEVEAGHADLVVGSRFAEASGYSTSWARRAGQRLFSLIVSTATRQTLTDTTSGMRALNRRAMALFATRYSSEFAEVESLQQAVRAGLTVKEVPVSMLPREQGNSFITPLGSAFYIFKTLIVLLVGQLRPRTPAPEAEK